MERYPRERDKPVRKVVRTLRDDVNQGAFRPEGFTNGLLCLRRETGQKRMGLQPQRAGRSGWVNANLLPPSRFVSSPMQLAMMAAAKRHCELVADLATECLPLDKAQMMRV